MKPIRKPLIAVLLLIVLLAPAVLVPAQSWVPTGAPITNWSSVACSADGSMVVAAIATYGAPIYISTNSGATWRPTTAPPQAAPPVVSSADGKILLATGCGAIYVSWDGGATWGTAPTVSPGACTTSV